MSNYDTHDYQRSKIVSSAIEELAGKRDDSEKHVLEAMLSHLQSTPEYLSADDSARERLEYCVMLRWEYILTQPPVTPASDSLAWMNELVLRAHCAGLTQDDLACEDLDEFITRAKEVC